MKTDTIHKTITFFLSILLFSMNSMSQQVKEFAPVGVEWTYDLYDGWNAASIYEKVISESKSNDSTFKIKNGKRINTRVLPNGMYTVKASSTKQPPIFLKLQIIH